MSFSACLRSCLSICLPSGFVFHLGWGAVSASLVCGLVSQFVSHLALSPHLFPIWLCLSPWLGCCVRLAGLVCGLVSQFVSHLALIWLCLLAWLGCCVRLAGLVSGLVSQCVSQFVSHLALSPSFVSPFVLHLALSFTLAGVLCPPRWACLQFVRHLPLSFSLAGVLCPPRWACLPICLPTCLPPHFVFHLLCPPPWACLLICLPICLPSGFVFHLGWDAVSASLACLRSRLPACFPSGLGCSVRLPGLVSLLSLVLSPSFCLVACLSSGMLCLPPPFVEI